MTKYAGVTPGSLKFRNIRYTKEGRIATVMINRPKVHNCLDLATLREMGRAFEDASWDNEIGVVVVTGAGSKAFCTGADLKEWHADFMDSPNDFYKWMGVFVETFEKLRNIGKPTIARLNGMAVGGGNELQMSCDLAIAADDVFIRHVGTEHGSVPAAGATQWLPIFVGDRRAREILFLCEPISAQKAVEWGLINMAVPREELDDAVREMASKLLRKLPECTRYTKQQLNFWRDFSWAMTIGNVRDWLTVHTGAPEIRMSIEAFMNKQPVPYEEIRKLHALGGNMGSTKGTKGTKKRKRS